MKNTAGHVTEKNSQIHLPLDLPMVENILRVTVLTLKTPFMFYQLIFI